MLRDEESDAHSVPTIPLAEVIAVADGPVRLLKLDCEGAEYAILEGVDLSQVRQICGEAHDITVCGKRHGIDDVLTSLRSHAVIHYYKNGSMI